MEAYFKSGDKVFEIRYTERYSKESATEAQKKVTCDDDYEILKVKGKHEVMEVKILQDSYSKESITISKNSITRLYKFIAELEAKECETTLSDYYA